MITKIEILADDVHVHFSGENSEIFPNIWLRAVSYTHLRAHET